MTNTPRGIPFPSRALAILPRWLRSPCRAAFLSFPVLALAGPVLADATITYTTPSVGVEGSCDGAGGSSPVLTQIYECLLFRNGNFEGPLPCDGQPIITAADAGDVFGFRICGQCGGDISVTGQCTAGQMGNEEQVTIGTPAAGTVTVVVDDPPPPPPPPLAECEDLADNDSDGDIDFPADAGCSSPDDDDESDDPPSCVPATSLQCTDECDNDGDGFVDRSDPQCTSPSDNDESA